MRTQLLSRIIRPRVPYVQQLHMSDCGPTCLAMVLRFHGRHVLLDEVRERFPGGRDGTSAFDILEAARSFGLEGRAVRLELEDLPLLPPGSILHWRMSHFVILERLRKNGVDLVDPDGGPRFVTSEELARSFTGVAILLDPVETFERKRKEASRLWEYAHNIAKRSGLLGRTILTSVLLQLFALALPVATGTVVDRVIPRQDESLLTVLFAGIAVLAVYSFFASFVRSHLLLALRTELDFQMTSGFLRHLLRLPFSFFQLRHTGDLLLRLDSNAVIRESLTST
ncbi:MAG TPA: cysteine peptidase family C39 domain-containing protein, partial [bacterium]|nr:cysteine peptidase family C39 domain-containing protein [bacterium]